MLLDTVAVVKLRELQFQKVRWHIAEGKILIMSFQACERSTTSGAKSEDTGDQICRLDCGELKSVLKRCAVPPE